MRGLLVRIGADLSEAGGGFNGPVNGTTNEFTYVPISEKEEKQTRQGMERPYTLVSDALSRLGRQLPAPLRERNMHLDPDFEHLTYGDEGCKGCRIYKMWKHKDGRDFLVFYAGLRDVNPDNERLVYAIVGFYMIDEIVQATEVPLRRCDENAHTRCVQPGDDEIVVRAKSGESGRLRRCLTIGCHRPHRDRPRRPASYRVMPDLLEEWGCLSVSDGYLQRSAYIPEFKNAERFLTWFRQCKPDLDARNN